VKDGSGDSPRTGVFIVFKPLRKELLSVGSDHSNEEAFLKRVSKAIIMDVLRQVEDPANR
jgi:hypothetical protein